MTYNKYRNPVEVISSMRDLIPSNESLPVEKKAPNPTQHPLVDNHYDRSSLIKSHFGIDVKKPSVSNYVPSNGIAEQILDIYTKNLLEPFEKWKKEEQNNQDISSTYKK